MFTLDPKRMEAEIESKNPSMGSLDVLRESNRCINCYDAPCIRACPTRINIPQFIRRIAEDNLQGAAETILQANILGLSCSKACPVEELCEGSCVYNIPGSEAISIGKLQQHAMENFFQKPQKTFQAKKKVGYRVALIGAGPASLSCAAYLSLAGVESHIFEKEGYPGGLNLTGIAPYKLKGEDVMKEIQFLQDLGVIFHMESPITEAADLQKLREDYDAVFLGMGLGKSRIPESFRNSPIVRPAVELIRQVKLSRFEGADKLESCLVIGGGNTSLDVVQILAKISSAKVRLAYRGPEEKLRAYKHEVIRARSLGVEFLFNTQITGIEGAEAPANVSLSGPQGNFDISTDLLVFAIGEEKHLLQRLLPELGLHEDGTVQVDAESMESNLSGIFAGGDCVNGGMEVVNAVAEGKKAAQAILRSFNLEAKDA